MSGASIETTMIASFWSAALLHSAQHDLAGAAGRVRQLEQHLEAGLAAASLRCVRGVPSDCWADDQQDRAWVQFPPPTVIGTPRERNISAERRPWTSSRTSKLRPGDADATARVGVASPRPRRQDVSATQDLPQSFAD